MGKSCCKVVIAVSLIICAAMGPPAAAGADSRSAPWSGTQRSVPVPLDIAKAYLQAIQARDFNAAYGYISTVDRRIRDKHSYLRGHQPLSGFALELARWFAAEMKLWIVEERAGLNRVRLDVGYRLPAGDEVANRLFNWNPDKLNALSSQQQRAIVDAVEKLKASGKMITFEGREKVDLVLEKQGWRVFEDWRTRRRVLFQASQQKPAILGVEFLRNDVWVKGDEPFQVDFKVTNQSDREVWVQVRHLFTPGTTEKNIDMIACGSLMPFRLEPREVREISSVYLFRRAIPAQRRVSIIYEFNPVER